MGARAESCVPTYSNSWRGLSPLLLLYPSSARPAVALTLFHPLCHFPPRARCVSFALHLRSGHLCTLCGAPHAIARLHVCVCSCDIYVYVHVTSKVAYDE